MLHNLVAESVSRHPEQVCIVFDSGKGEASEQQRITYSQLWEQVTELKLAFESLSLKEQIVGVSLVDGPAIPSVLLGLLSSSCAFQPFNPECLQYTATSLIQSGVSWILAHSELIQKLSPLLKQLEGSQVPSEVLTKNGLQLYKIKHCSLPAFSPVKHFDLAYCMTTSGTTNAPKVVRVPHSCIVPNIKDFRNIFQLSSNDRVLLTSAITFDPSIIDIFCTLSSGACLIIVPNEVKRRPDMLLNFIHDRQAVTVMQATPTLMRSFSPGKLQRTILGPDSSLRVLALDGEPFPTSDNLKAWLHADNNFTQFYNLYGLTEVSCLASYQHVDVRAVIEKDEPVPIGAALSETVIKLMPAGSEGENLDSYEEGDIWIGSKTRICIIDNEVCENNQEKCTVIGEQPEVFWRNTGDRGKLLSDGSILYVGRRDEQVNRHAKRLNLEALEMACKEVRGVLDCCALLDQSNIMVFIIMGSTSSDNLEKDPENNTAFSRIGDKPSLEQSGDEADTDWGNLQQRLKAHIEDDLPSQYKPTIFVKISGSFPVTQHGKLDKKLLVQIGNAEMKAAGTEIRNVWTFSQELWMTNLPDASVKIHLSDNFISLGGDYFAALRVINTLENVVRCSLPNMSDVLLSKNFEHFVEELQRYYTPQAIKL